MSFEPDTILLVDDHGESREALRSVLEGEGFKLETACDGREALNKLLGGLRPCIIVLDLDMPVMTGYAFRQAQMVYPQLSSIPAVLFSADPNVAETASQMQVQAYAAKPIELQKMLKIILRYCIR